MSRVRIGYVVACFGILITTGGCAQSATGPSAANVEASAVRGKKQTPPSDSTSIETGGDGVYTTSSGFISGGSRAEP
ncbi:MAG TPA: hypothetical protein VFT45_21640 [Longimicrobium sp.]|nr:hypothetical protein [Longimicrobium sp.]